MKLIAVFILTIGLAAASDLRAIMRERARESRGKRNVLESTSERALVGKQDVTVNAHTITIQGKRYARHNAHDAELGRMGQTLSAKGTDIDFQDNPPPQWLEGNVRMGPTFSLSQQDTSEFEVDVNAALAGVGTSGGGAFSFGGSRDEDRQINLQVITFENEGPIVNYFWTLVNNAQVPPLVRYSDEWITANRLKREALEPHTEVGSLRIATTVLMILPGSALQTIRQCTNSSTGLNVAISPVPGAPAAATAVAAATTAASLAETNAATDPAPAADATPPAADATPPAADATPPAADATPPATDATPTAAAAAAAGVAGAAPGTGSVGVQFTHITCRDAVVAVSPNAIIGFEASYLEFDGTESDGTPTMDVDDTYWPSSLQPDVH